MANSEQGSEALYALRAALDDQRSKVQPYARQSEVITYEVLRALDDLFMTNLMEPSRKLAAEEDHYRKLSTWGVNKALRSVLPPTLQAQPFKDFPSRQANQEKCDDLLFECAMLEIGERYEAWLREGIIKGELRRHSRPDDDADTDVLILSDHAPSYFDEEIGWNGLQWASSVATWNNRGHERRLEQRHRKMARHMERCVELVGGWKVSYSTTKDIDDYFSEWARLYLKRMQSQDLVGPDDVIGGRPFSRYVSVLEALSARSQKHIAFAAMLRARSRSADMRNLLTTYANRTYFIESVSAYMDADTREISEILDSLILSGENLDVHTSRSEAAWAPVVQASSETFILPVYGLDINPFQFLLTDLRARYESDWFRIANNREARWVGELEQLYAGPRWQRNTGNLKLRLDGKVATDIDFATLDTKTNELAIFQLKWQQPVSLDNRVRRSTGQNLVNESNRWIDVVLSWLTQNGVGELVGRLGFQSPKSPTVHLFVLGRYHARITGFDNHDQQAVWCSWAHFKRMRTEGPRRSVSQLAGDLRSSVHQLRSSKKGESSMLLVGELPVVINPTSTPPAPLVKPAPN
ncbi:hypothetical protein [Shinella oryzae]|uniref:hypothetical protein n=1 Tax=Shinella oryzae TaxID=2871820 RepID=UPI001FF419E8|nr:hypothetical protein [Shinella oryzae]UPA27010.1 hypothetical protein K6301_24235 [Shinella oryzae]